MLDSPAIPSRMVLSHRAKRAGSTSPAPKAPGKNTRDQLRGLGVPRLNIRPARVGDVPSIHELIRTFADQKLMIRRSPGELYESIREFFVAVDANGQVIGCAALHVFWEDLAELKCLAVSEKAQGQGVGRKLVEACWASAGDLEIKTVFTLTYVPDFFERCGFHQIEKAELPHKIWNECVRCPLFPNCTEVALIRSTEQAPLSNGLLATVEV